MSMVSSANENDLPFMGFKKTGMLLKAFYKLTKWTVLQVVTTELSLPSAIKCLVYGALTSSTQVTKEKDAGPYTGSLPKIKEHKYHEQTWQNYF